MRASEESEGTILTLQIWSTKRRELRSTTSPPPSFLASQLGRPCALADEPTLPNRCTAHTVKILVHKWRTFPLHLHRATFIIGSLPARLQSPTRSQAGSSPSISPFPILQPAQLKSPCTSPTHSRSGTCSRSSKAPPPRVPVRPLDFLPLPLPFLTTPAEPKSHTQD